MRMLLSLFAGIGLVLATTLAQATTWNMATPYPDTTFHTQNIRQFAADIDKATHGKLKIIVHSGGSLIKHPQIKRAVQTMQVQAGEVFISILGNENPIYTVDSIPFLATSYPEARKLWDASRPYIEARLKKDGLMLLYSVPWPPQGLYTSRDVKTVADLKGLKFRAYNQATAKFAQLAGMVPTQVEVPDIPQAFATGIVDAMITSPSTGANTKAWDFVKRFYDIQAWIPKNMVIINRRAFESLSAEEQKAVLNAAAAAETRGWNMSEKEASEKKKILAAHGIKVIQPSPALESGLKAIGKTITDEWLKAAGPDGAAIIKAYRQ